MIKNIISRLLFLSILLCTLNTISAQKYKDHKWYKAKPHTVIPDSLLGEDAVMIYNNQYIYNDIVDLRTNNFSSKRTVMQKIKIITQKGLEEYSKVFVNIYPNEYIKIVDARTIKANGKTVDLKSKDIKQLNFKSRFYKDSRFQQLRFSIPGVEIGDEIEIIYTAKTGKLRMAGDIIMNTYLPCLSASVTYGSSRAFVHEFKMYNNMANFVNKSSQTNTTLVWVMSNLRSIGNEYRAIYTNQIPFIRYVIRRYSDGAYSQDLSINDWNNLYNKYKDYYTDLSIVKEKRSLKALIQRFKDEDLEASNTQVFMKIHQYVYENFEVKVLPDADKRRRIKFYLDKKEINNYNLYILYEQLFNDLGIKRYMCFGRDKYNGKLDRNFVAPHIVQHDFFAFKDVNQLHFVYPSFSTRKYLLDELPLSLRGTNIMMIADGEEGSIFKDSKEITLPMNGPEKNYKLKKLKIQVDNLLDSAFSSSSSTTLSGVYSTMYRLNHKKEIDKNEYDFYASFISENEMKIDSLNISNSRTKFPYNYTLNSIQKIPLQFSQIDDNLYNLRIGELFSISDLYAPDKKRYLKYHTKYMYNDMTIVQVEFAKSIKIENLEQINKMFKNNSFGSVSINLVQKGEKTLIINISYKITEIGLQFSEYHKLRDLNIALEDLLNQKISLTIE